MGFYLGICCIVIFTNLEVLTISLALPSIAQALNLALPTLQSFFNIFLYGALISFSYFGYQCTRSGKLVTYRWGMVILLLGTAMICLFDQCFPLLILGRFLQGVGFSGALAIGLSLISDCFPKHHYRLAIGSTLMVSGISQTLGPIFGGWIISTWNWKFLFISELPLIAIAIALSFLKKETSSLKPQPWIWKKWLYWSFLMSLIFFSTETHHLAAKTILLLLGSLGIIGLVNFRWPKNISLVPEALFLNQRIQKGMILRVFVMSYFSSLTFLISLYFQSILCWSPSSYGKLLCIMTSFYTLTSFIYGITSKIKLPISNISINISAIGIILLITYLFTNNNETLLTGLIFSGVGFGFLMPHSLCMVTENTPSKVSGEMMSFFYCIGFLSSMVSITLSGLFLEASVSLFNLTSNISIRFQELTALNTLHAKPIFKLSMTCILMVLLITSCWLQLFFKKREKKIDPLNLSN